MTTAAKPVAIIGIGLRLPGADSLDDLWRHLATQTSLISEVPTQRWNKREWRGNPAKGNKTNSIWGGFLADADGFDADFFAVSPREAAWMDPQQRFALEMSWHAIEDAGYRPSSLAGSKTGVFMGVCHWDYAELLEKHTAQLDAYTPTGIAFSIITNRVSHFFDFHGPSVTNDTACAASLTAINDAVRALATGECDLALAGGVNLIWSPNHFVAFSKAGMLSKDGRAKAFDDAADGYVRGEGGAVLLLKPLDQALADGDPIHAVIRGIGTNHGGRTNSLTVTNPQAQADLIVAVHQGAGIDPACVDYIEAHGPGTPLGDPIEIAGLKDAFARLHAAVGSAPQPGRVGVGSVKTNMGHLEGAAGVAGLAKVLAALRHDSLPANVGFHQLNRLIDLDGTPLRIQAEATPWPRRDNSPRLAAVSSFGFGGSNAHVVVADGPATAVTDFPGPFVLPLSAKSAARLPVLAGLLADFVAAHPDLLAALSHTLQSGREDFEYRAAVSAATAAEAEAALRQIAIGGDSTQPGIAAPWLAGEAVDWSALWPQGTPARIHAPLYPFDRQRHWFDQSLLPKDENPLPHPLLHHNRSDFSTIRFQTRLSGGEFFWAEHHVNGQQVLPGVAALEMARAAIAAAGIAGLLRFDEVVWLRPIRAGDGATLLEMRLQRSDDGTIAFSLENDGVVHCQGMARAHQTPAATVDINALRAAHAGEIRAADCYDHLRASGVVHGPSFQALAWLGQGDGSVLAHLKLARRLLPGLEAMALHPVLLDAAIQAWVALDGAAMTGAAVPFACAGLNVHGPCEPVMWAHVRPLATRGDAVRKLAIALYGKAGNLVLSIDELTLRVMAAPGETSPTTDQHPLLFIGTDWQNMPLTPRRQPLEVVRVAAMPLSDDWAQAVPAGYGAVYDRIAQVIASKPRRPLQIQVIVADDVAPALTAPIAALLRIARLEQPKLDAVLIRLAPGQDAEAASAAESRRADGWSEIRYDRDGSRHARVATQTTLPAATVKIDTDGAYWVTGGLGGLGRIFIGWLQAKGAGRIFASGRAITAEVPAGVTYIPCDLADAAQVDAAVAQMGTLKGIIHAAGILDDGYIGTGKATSATFAAKVAGTLNLDRATARHALDFIVLCSSVAALFGNAGQAGYGAANAFLDGFAQHRNLLAADGHRSGRTVSMAWPLWAQGGMNMDAATLAVLHRHWGTVPMPSAAGLDALERALAAGGSGLGVLHGDLAIARRALATQGHGVAEAAEEAVSTDTGDLARRTQDFVRDILAEVLQLEPQQIRANRKLDEYGLDSIAIVDATTRLEEALGPLSKTLFFEYVDLTGIATHLAEEHGAALTKVLGLTAASPAAPLVTAEKVERKTDTSHGAHDVAVVGLSLKVSKAEDQESFWAMLADGLHGFEPYPQERWDHAALLHPERDVLGKTVVKTGCFLDDIAAFDPRYFRISQYEAELMAPEVRLFLQSAVEAFEDAGYSRETMARKFDGDVAVIMGSMTNEYDYFGFQNMLVRGALASGSYTGTVPNMVSYFYGFTGPSYFLDTMCSASSTCVHEAVHMLRSGRTKMALAGGVSLLTHPQKLIATSQEHFTTKTAEVIRGYGLGADGTILGEGVGALVLKRLEDAERDGDHIYGVIRGTAVSNAGVRNGFTVPNPRQQAAAIEQALDDAGLDASTISYIEGHGSGTALGDPIEIKALTQAFRRHTDAVGSCPIGTVKSNVGHLLAASGLAGMVKVLMQMKHGQLAPSLHAETLNPNIPFATTPFVVQRTLAPWPRRQDAHGHDIPRRAGVTSIGAGGMNSHIIIEEYVAAAIDAPAETGPHLLVFSALSEAKLVQVVERVLSVLDSLPLAALAYTLQVGKNELPCRLAVIAADHGQARNQLSAFVAAPGPAAGRHYVRTILDADPIDLPVGETSPETVARAWVSGAAIDWDRLHPGHQPRRLSLPAYPFDKVRCWYPEQDDAPSVTRPLGPGQKLHPLIGRNVSDLSGLRYVTALHLSELLDYQYKDQRQPQLLPLAAAEALAALARIAGHGAVALADLRLAAPAAWAKVSEIGAAVDGDSIRLSVTDDRERPWAEARLVAAGVLPSLTLGHGPRRAGVEVYAQWQTQGLDFAPYGEVIDSIETLPDGGLVLHLRADPPQQDHDKKNLLLSAPALAAACQGLLLTRPDADIASIARLDFGPPGDVARVLVRADAIWFLGADNTVRAGFAGISANAPVQTEAPPAETHTSSRLAEDLRDIAADLLKFPPDQVNLRDSFQDLGFDSISLTRLAEAVSTAYGLTMSPAIFFECDHLDALADHLASRHGIAAAPVRPVPAKAQALAIAPKPQTIRAPSRATSGDAIAIIGMAGSFPGAADPEALFAGLLDGADLTGDLPLGRYDADTAARIQAADFPKRGGFLADIDRFDAGLFKVSPVEVERMDPQQRLMLECMWRVLEDAGYAPDDLPADTAVLVGASALDYLQLLRDHGVKCDGYVATGNSLAMIANRVSHVFNLHGPSQTIDTACSSSLVALGRAVQSLRAGHCSAALVGGVHLALSADGFIGPHQAGMLAPDGRCKSFGAAADGYGRGEGVAALLLKRQEDAERDGDRILGLIVGVAENHGGRAGSLTAPNVNAQAQLIETAMAGIDATSVSYIEAHGTGTNLGDPVEISGLARAYASLLGRESVPQPFIAIGSLKANIGHLEAAAGLAGVIKVLLAMRHGVLPASPHCVPANPHLPLAGTPFFLLDAKRNWPAGRQPRRAGVSSFGFGGANAHVVLEDYVPSTPPKRQPLPPRVFADTRFWLPGHGDKVVTMVPAWQPADLPAAYASQRLVLAVDVDVPGAHALSGQSLAQAAAAVLDIVKSRLAGPDSLIQLVAPVGSPLLGLSGLLDTAALESSRLSVQVIELAGHMADLPAHLARWAGGPGRLRLSDGAALMQVWRDLPVPTTPHVWQPGAVTLITGAMGGLGRLVAADIAARAPGAVLVLIGSRPEDAERTAFVTQLRAAGAIAAYRQVDMADDRAVAGLIRAIVEVHGRLDTIIHCAGTLRDGFIAGKSAADMAAVLAAKTDGAASLIRACADIDIGRIVLFASIAGIAGNDGQADYACANAGLDALAQAHGLPVVAIDWPLWADGGMTIDSATGQSLFNRMGQRPLTTIDGLTALHRILAAGVPQAAVLAGDEARIRTFFAGLHPPPATMVAASVGDSRLGPMVAIKLCALFAQTSGFAPGSIDAESALDQYGIDSLMITRLNASLADIFGPLPKALFFEFRTIAQIADHLAATQADACRRWTKMQETAPVAPRPDPQPRPAIPPHAADEPIAIIGIAGRYPGGDSLEEWWQALAAGRDLIGEIPADRWSLDGFFNADRDAAVENGQSYAKWGGFLDGFADFDPLFFKISPRDAAAMDPQERLLLTSAWQAFEDAGYGPERLAGARVGVFIGATKTGYALHGPFVGDGGAMVRPATSFASMANRISHVLDLAGPSIAVDTMCSSSLVALHQACESLRRGEASMVVTGGVNLYLHPSTFTELSAARMLSPSGRCHSFGADADGFVPGEGVGCVVLKPLSQAIADGDHIHAVIRATAINHGGHTHGYTVPNPAAQRRLVQDALAKAGLSAADMSYIEAHGTGTELGDPIEVEALAGAFAADTDRRGFCALGSVKSNMGHLEAAAGIAGLTKVVLQMRHGQLAPSLHAARTNPNLELERTPFVLNRTLTPWTGRKLAGISSFGAGGANAHVIVEAYEPALTKTVQSGPQAIIISAADAPRLRRQVEKLLARLTTTAADPLPRLVAKLAEMLSVAADQIDADEDFDSQGLEVAQHLGLRRWTEDAFATRLDPAGFAHARNLRHLAALLPMGAVQEGPALADIAFTLQVGRPGLDHRLGFVAANTADLAAQLHRWLDSGSAHHQGTTAEAAEVVALLGGSAEARQMIAAWWDQGRLDRVLALWVKGIAVDWSKLPRANAPQVVTLPGVEFAPRRFWLPQPADPGRIITQPQGDAALRSEAERLDAAIAAILRGILAQIPEQSVIARYRQWFTAAQHLLANHAASADPWADWGRMRAQDGPAAQMDLAETTLKALPDILTGTRVATAVMFPDGAMTLVEAVYKANRIAARFSYTLAETAAAWIAGQTGAVRILEIGAGTGGTSAPVLAALVPHADKVAEYAYTDLSRAFLIHAERTYRPHWPQLRPHLFDVEKPPAAQGLETGAYDLVIAANVLHATADMGRTLDHVRQLLAPGGVLLLNETSMATLFTHVTFGLLDGWWRFTDAPIRIPGTPSLTQASWRALLERTGLSWLAGSGLAEQRLGQQLIAARVPGAPVARTMPAAPAKAPTIMPPMTGTDLHQRLRVVLGETLNMAPTTIDPAKSFADYGLDSILGADLVHRLRRELDVELSQTDLYDHTNLAQLERFLATQAPAVTTLTVQQTPQAQNREPIAIVGYSGRFAGSPDADALWAHLAAGDDLVGPVTRFTVPVPPGADPASIGTQGSFIDGVENFDPVFFGISGLEATYMDPQQRLFLEESWKTLEHAGHAGPAIIGARVGVFAGCSSGDYDRLFGADVPGQAFWGNTSSLIPARIAYFLDFKGPAVAVDTACSSSLVAVHMACQSLWNGDIDMALAGGVFIQCSDRFFRSANQATMLSPSGNCAAFGAKADGIVPGEAVAALLLRPLSAALADGDTVHGVIVGSGLNQDGTTNGITAPSAASQERLIRQVQAEFAIDPASIDMIEAHGTGTPLGDPIEHNALARVFAEQPIGSVVLGSVKSNIGHATTAAGIAGMVKVLESLRHATIPATLHFDGGNPAIDFAASPLRLNTQAEPWPQRDHPRRAGLSSFGFSGTNAHVVVEQAPAQAPTLSQGCYDFRLSARNAQQLRHMAESLADHLDRHPELSAADVAFTLAVGRRRLPERLAVTASSIIELATALRQWLAGQTPATVRENDGTEPAVAAGHRVPLPTYPFAPIRHWVKSAEAQAKPVAAPTAESETIPSFPVRLPAPTAPLFAPSPAFRPVALAPLGTAGQVERRGDTDGVRHLHLRGSHGLAVELAQASADQAVRVIRLSAETAPPADLALDCAVPVVTSFAASAADFPNRDEAEAQLLAARIATAPRLALVELKAAMRQPGRLPDAELPALTTLAQPADGPSSGLHIALTTRCVSVEILDDGVALLRMVEREQKNSFTDVFMDGLAEAFAALAADNRAKVVVLTGFDGYFACGGTREGLSALQQGATRFTDRKIYALPLDCPLPVIAAMQGHAIGAGWSLGMFCDHQLFAAEGVYHSNYLWYGFTPGAGATLVFPYRLGDDLGREVLFSAHEYRGRELSVRHAGLDVRPAGHVLPAALSQAHGLARLDRGQLMDWKALARAAIAGKLERVFAEEVAMHEKTFIGNDRVRERIERMFPSASQSVTAAPARPTDDRVRTLVIQSLAEDLMITPADIRDDSGFLELGLDSILAVTWVRKLGTLLDQDLPATVIYAHPSVGALIDHLGGQAAPVPPPPAAIPATPTLPPVTDTVRDRLVASLAEDLMIAPADIRDDAGFLELGLDSILAVTWVRKLGTLFGQDLPATVIYAHPTVGALVAHVAAQAPAVAPPPAPPVAVSPVAAPAARRDRRDRSAADAVAIIGASGRYPQAIDLDSFWDNIRQGRDCIAEVPPSRWDIDRFYHPDPAHPGTSSCRWMGAIDDVDCFDAGFFTITPREAELMDPQQRLFLQHAWAAIEDAGIDPTSLGGAACGIFVGAGPSGYADLIDEHNAYSLLGSSGSILAARIAHLLDLRGPCVSLDTACSSSLVAIAEACNALLLGDADLALAGGVSVMIGPEMFIDTSKVGMLSADGRCFTFDARANGFVPGEGVGVLLLKRLDDAERDGDPIHAVIRGWGINQDGRTNGITAPNPQAQTRLIRQVQDRFDIPATSIGLIECHGTGTPLGDPIEIEGLTDAFAGSGLPEGACALGSVKSNMGHLLAAAGVAGLTKAMLAVEHGELPPSIHCQNLNPHIRLSGTPFAVNTRLRPWPRPATGPRRAAVSAFGFSGTNAHVVVEQAPARPELPQTGPWLFPLSTRKPERLAEYAGVLERFVAGHPELRLGDIAYTLQAGRKNQPHRVVLQATDRDGLLRQLAAVVAGQKTADPADATARRWLAGEAVDWTKPAGSRRCHLPGVPFARDRHWIDIPAVAPPTAVATPLPAALRVHGDEDWLTARLDGDARLALGLFLPEMARVAAEIHSGRTVRGLTRLLWGKPVRVNGKPRRFEAVADEDEAGLFYHVAVDGDDDHPCHVGEVLEVAPALTPLSELEAGTDTTADYRRFAEQLALYSGPPAATAPTVLSVRKNGDQLTARLRRGKAEALPFDPLVLDAAWRLAAYAGDANCPMAFPHAMESLWAARPLPAELVVRISGTTIAIADATGIPCLVLTGLRLNQPEHLAEIRIAEETPS